MISALALALNLAATPRDARFIFEVAHVPIAELSVSVRGQRYQYQVRRFFDEAEVSSKTFVLSPQKPLPEVLALMERQSLGCHHVLEERTEQLEMLCVSSSTPKAMHGTLDGQVFTANYAADGALQHVAVGDARWVATDERPAAPAVNPFAEGIAVPPGPLEVRPQYQEARWLAQSPTGVGRVNTIGQRRCLELAREFIEHNPDARLSMGLVVERGRAYPHAWVTTPQGAVDPSMLPHDELLQSRRYLEVPVTQSGIFFLKFWNGTFKLHPVGK